MSIRVTASKPDSLDAHGRLPNRVALHVRRSTSGLQDYLKLSGAAMDLIGLCSKTYYCFGATNKCSTKGLNKRQNNIDKDAFLDVLTNRRSGSGVNRGFRVHNSTVMTYVQEREALTYFYAKSKVLADGLTTAPLDI